MKRKELNIFENQNASEEVRKNVLKWKELHKDERTLYHSFGHTVHSIRKDIRNEAEEVLNRFHINILPEYEPAYLYVNKEIIEKFEALLMPEEFEEIKDFEDFFTNTFNCFTLLNSKKVKLDNIIHGIMLSENIFGVVTQDGNILTYDYIKNEILKTLYSNLNNQKYEYVETFSERYYFIPKNIKIFSIVDNNGKPVNYTIKYITESEYYENVYDINSNGVIDEDDLNLFIEADGISFENTIPEIWNEKYRKLDISKTGFIGSKEINKVKQLLWTGSSQGTLIIFEDIRPYSKIQFKEITTPEVSSLYKYNNKINYNRNNTLNSDILIKNLANNIGTNGLVINEQNVQVELTVNFELNMVRIYDLNIVKEKLSYLDMDKYKPICICMSDDVLYFLTKWNNLFRIYVCDTRLEGVEYTTQFYKISITGKPVFIDVLEPENILSIGYIENSELYINKYYLDKKFYYLEQNSKTLYVSKRVPVNMETHIDGSEEILNQNITLIPRKIQNSIDDYAFNWGVYRLPGETNKELKNRLKDYFVHLQGNNLEGMYYGIAKEIGIPLSELDNYKSPVSKKVILKEYWYKKMPIRLLIVDNKNQELSLFGFKFHEGDSLIGLYKIDSTSIEIPDELEVYFKNFINYSYVNEPVSKINNEWIYNNETEVSANEKITITNGLLHFESMEFLKQFAGLEVAIFYDTMDTIGNVHLNYYDVYSIPFSNEQLVKKIIIEDLLHPGNFKNELILNEINRENIIKEWKAQDDSRWENTTNEISYYNIRPTSSQNLKDSIWNGFAFNKHFKEMIWRY